MPCPPRRLTARRVWPAVRHHPRPTERQPPLHSATCVRATAPAEFPKTPSWSFVALITLAVACTRASPPQQPIEAATASVDLTTSPPTAATGGGQPVPSSTVSTATTPCKRIPTNWNVPAMLKDTATAQTLAYTDGGYQDTSQASFATEVLAWNILEDSRFNRTGNALVWVSMSRPGHPTVWGFLHYLLRPATTHWAFDYHSEHRYAAFNVFSERPNAADLDSFLALTQWTFTPPSGDTLVDGEVCGDAWQRSIGSPPTRSYAPSTH
jgi:hypothetical protein